MTYSNLVLYAHCIPIRGFKNSIICNIQDGTYYNIPNDMYDVLSDTRLLDISNLTNTYGNGNRESLISYLNLLINNESVFQLRNSKMLDYFPKLNLQFESPSSIDNAILDIDKENLNLGQTISELEKNCCQAILIRLIYSSTLADIIKILNFFEMSCISHIELCLKNTFFERNELEEIFKRCLRLHSITVFGAKFDSDFKVTLEDGRILGLIQERKAKLFQNSHCATISPNVFVLNMQHFSESQNYNNCLFKKVFIDTYGNIKNCPCMPESYGNIKDTTLEEAINKPGFKKYWNITKDDIEVCRDCEFRYICTDCRAYTERTKFSDEGLDLSKPLKCGYNPYTNEWAEWSTNPLKEKAIEYYGMKEIIENDKK